MKNRERCNRRQRPIRLYHGATMRSKEFPVTPDSTPEFVRRFTEFGPAGLDSISTPAYEDGKMYLSVYTHMRDLNGKTSRVAFCFQDVTMMKMKEGPDATFQQIAEITIEFIDGKIRVDFHSADKDSDFIVYAKSLRCMMESRC